MIISSAPGRCGVVGNPTDMYGGSVISCTTTECAHCTIEKATSLILRAGDCVQEIKGVDDLRLTGDYLDISKAVLIYFQVDPAKFQADMRTWTDVPEQAGLAGSTALVVAVLGAVAAKLGIKMDPYCVAETARKIEFGIMGITCGFQDQHMASFGGLNFIDLREKERMAQDDDEPLATVEPMAGLVRDLPIVLAHTGIMRNSGVVHKSIRDRWLEGEPAVVDGYLRIAHLARLGKKALLMSDWARLGELMNENHNIQRDLGGSGAQNEVLIEAALAAGALGAKLAGAGKGGTIIALSKDTESIAKALTDAGAKRILWPKPSSGLTVEVRT